MEDPEPWHIPTGSKYGPVRIIIRVTALPRIYIGTQQTALGFYWSYDHNTLKYYIHLYFILHFNLILLCFVFFFVVFYQFS